MVNSNKVNSNKVNSNKVNSNKVSNLYKSNPKNKYFLLQVLNLANCYKDIDPNHSIFLKTKRLDLPFSHFEIKRRANILVKLGALTVENTGGQSIPKPNSTNEYIFAATTYKFNFSILHNLYMSMRDVPIVDLYKVALKHEINHGIYVKKDVDLLEKTIKTDGKVKSKKVKRLDVSEAFVSSKYRCSRFVDSYQEALDKVHERYFYTFNKLKRDLNICNSMLDDRRHMSMTDKITLNQYGLIQKIGERCTNSLVNAKTHGVEHDEYGNILNKEASRRYKEDVLKYYSLHEYDNSDVSTSIPRLTYVYNKKGNWNDIKDFYVTIFNKALSNMGIKYQFVRDKNDVNKEKLRDSIKSLLLPCYFDRSAKAAAHHIVVRSPKKERELALSYACYLYSKDINDIDTRKKFVESFYTSMREVIGQTLDSEVFLLESAAYASVAAIIAERNIQFWQVYDALYTSEYVPDLSQLYEEQVNEACYRLAEDKKRRVNRNIIIQRNTEYEESILLEKDIEDIDMKDIDNKDTDNKDNKDTDNTLVITFLMNDDDDNDDEVHYSSASESESESESIETTIQKIAVSEANRLRSESDDGYKSVSEANRLRSESDGYKSVSESNKQRSESDGYKSVSESNKQRSESDDGYKSVSEAQKYRAKKEDGYKSVSESNKQRSESDGYKSVSESNKQRSESDGYKSVSESNRLRFRSEEKDRDIMILSKQEYIEKYKVSSRSYYNRLRKLNINK